MFNHHSKHNNHQQYQQRNNRAHQQGTSSNNHHGGFSSHHESRAGLGHSQINSSSSHNRRRNNQTLFGTPIFDGDEENERELKAHNQERYTSEHQQYATDEKGRRRFHGAFTGGYSAGYFNTVGSKEGWNPSNDFRLERKITDFMDEEDMKEIFGLSGSKQVQATDKFMKVTNKVIADPISDLFGGKINSSDQRHLEALFGSSEKLISLNDRSYDSNETNIGYSLLKKMGWIPSKGIGVKSYSKTDSVELHTDSKLSTVIIKEDKCGIGYKHSTLNDILNIQKPVHNNKKNTTEEEYYQEDDMSNYDIDLRTTQESEENTWDEKLIFIKSKQPFLNQTKYLPPKVPEDFVPNHIFNTEAIKKEYKKLDHKIQLHLMAAEERRKKLFESTNLNQKSVESSRQSEKSKEMQQHLAKSMSNRFVSSSDNGSTEASKSSTTRVNREKSRTISDWRPEPLLSKRFGCNPISIPVNTTTETTQKQSHVLAKDFIVEQNPDQSVKNQDKMEDGARPSIDLFKQVFETKVRNIIEHDDEVVPSNRIHTPQQTKSNEKSEDILSFDSVNSLKDIVKEMKESKGEVSSHSLIEKRKAVLESMKSKEKKEKKEVEVVEKKEEKKKLDFNVYPMKRDSTTSYIAQLESRISDIRKMLDSSSDDEERKKRKKHKKEKKEKKKRKQE
ncbi:predicted protein [Naegleria gruberi]|uniref:Predicted protein n=1 Tax=Naegleria gruberi TaxID=5762 RepID=D2V0G0_NAEGR|nr:uncharacterized protein NAEGRDRAFT_45689 [Naegleria gruberi]EFC49713.1 predicted protein [Naegleria gruberi]|eukprot:XP_002682457.1 predicted protein [Naegleria gruberi strain NEG-M]